MKTKYLMGALVALCLGVLAGCVSAPPAPPAKPAAVELASAARVDRAIVAATLAKVGTCEVDVAASYTAVVMNYQRATNALVRGQITVDIAKRVRDLTDTARADLDAACPDASAKLKPERLAAAQATLQTASQLLEKKP